MISLTAKVKALLRGRRGESLMECLVSIMIFTVLLATVSLMVNTSLIMTARSTVAANDMQNEANNTRLRVGSGTDATLELTGGSINVQIPITVAESAAGGFIAFANK